MTNAEQARRMAWRFKVLRQASEQSRNVARTCRHFGISHQARSTGHTPNVGSGTRSPQPGHRLQMDVKFLERIPASRKRLYQFTARLHPTADAASERQGRAITPCRRRIPLPPCCDGRAGFPFNQQPDRALLLR